MFFTALGASLCLLGMTFMSIEILFESRSGLLMGTFTGVTYLGLAVLFELPPG